MLYFDHLKVCETPDMIKMKNMCFCRTLNIHSADVRYRELVSERQNHPFSPLNPKWVSVNSRDALGLKKWDIWSLYLCGLCAHMHSTYA